MKNFKTRFLVLSGLMVLLAATLAPIVVEAQCPCIPIECSNGKTYCCAGTPQGTNCVYDRNCLNGGKCGGSGDFEPEEPILN